jgi:hypothetical protein
MLSTVEDTGLPSVAMMGKFVMSVNAQQDALTAATVATIERFNDAFDRHDVAAVMALMTEDRVFETLIDGKIPADTPLIAAR